MFWDKKESPKSLPNLPPMKYVPPVQAQQSLDDHEEEDTDEEQKKHGLPSFPDSPMQRGFSQSAIKDAITHENADDNAVGQPLPSATSSMKTVEVDEWSPQRSLPPPPTLPLVSSIRREAPLVSEIAHPSSTIAPQFTVPSRPSRSSKNTDIYVKLDKFYSARKALEATNMKLDEIDTLLHKIRETKMREEQELSGFEKDLATIKTRIKEVTETIFEKVE